MRFPIPGRIRSLSVVLALALLPAWTAAQPATWSIQGRLLNDDGDALPGQRAWAVTLYDAETGGTAVGSYNGSTTVSPAGVFALSIPWSQAQQDAPELWYELGIDTSPLPDGSVDLADVFAGRTEVQSVPFSQTVLQQGSGSGLNADLLDGMDSGDFATPADLTDFVTNAQLNTALGPYVTDAELSSELATALAPYVTDTDLANELATALAPYVTDAELSSELAAALAPYITQADLNSALAPYTTDADVAADIAAAIAGLLAAPGAPPAPTRLRMMPSRIDADHRRMMWNPDDTMPAGGWYLYESTQEITAQNKGSAIRRYTTQPELEIPVQIGTGERHYRVAGVSFAGEEGPLSEPFVLSTFPLLYLIGDLDIPGLDALYLSTTQPAARPLPLSGTNLGVSSNGVYDFTVSPRNNAVLYTVDRDRANDRELYLVSFEDRDFVSPSAPEKVNSPTFPGTDIDSFAFSPAGDVIVWIAVEPDLLSLMLYARDYELNNSADFLSIGGDLPILAPLRDFRFTPDGEGVVFTATTATNVKGLSSDVHEMFYVPLDGSKNPMKIETGLGLSAAVNEFRISPDGTTIAFAAAPPGTLNDALYTVPIGGGTAEPYTSPGGVDEDDFQFNPTGSLLYYRTDEFNKGSSNQQLVRAAPGTEFRLPISLGTSGTDEEFALPPFDSGAFMISDRIGAQGELLYQPPIYSATPVRLSFDIYIATPSLRRISVSPDGRLVAYEADYEDDGIRDLRLALADGSDTWLLSERDPSGSSISTRALFTPDSSQAFYLGRLDDPTQTELYGVDTSGPPAEQFKTPVFIGNSDADIVRFDISRFGFDPILEGFRENRS